MNDITILVKSLGIGAIPFIVGVFLYDKSDVLSQVISVFLLIFGMIILSVLVHDHLQTRKARRRHLGYGDLK